VRFNEFQGKVFNPYFKTEFLRQLFPTESPAQLALQLSRWCDAGKLLSLRRGLYAYPSSARAQPSLSNEIVSPSYLSGTWALSHYGMIPEAVWEYTAACKTTPRKQVWETPLGRFTYRQVKAFLGFERQTIHGQPTLVATPEKALLDHWYWSEGEWTSERHREMRYQNLEVINMNRLESLVARFASPKMNRALTTFQGIIAENLPGHHPIPA
jgi:predicted transcriptional regulator of viral defense system